MNSASPSSAPRFSSSLLVAWLAIIVIYGAGAAWMAAQNSVWSPDCGARLIQVQSILEHGPQWWVSYPAQALDPEHHNSSLYFFEFNHDGRTYIFYSFLFAHLSAFFFRHFGFFGLSMLPMLGGMGTAYCTFLIARLMRLRFPVAPMLLVALTTPVVLFSIVFWDHSITTGIATFALYLALRGIVENRPLLWLGAGVVLGAGLWLHEILLPLLPALIIGAWWTRRRHSFGRAAVLLTIGAVVLLIPLAIINKNVYGTMAGPHLANNRLGSGTDILKFMLNPSEWGPGAFYTLFGWGDYSPAYTWELKDAIAHPTPQMTHEFAMSLRMSWPLIASMVLALSGWWHRLWPLVLLLWAGVVADGYWVLSRDQTPHSLLLVCPLLLLAFGARPSLSRPQTPADNSPPLSHTDAETQAADGRLVTQTVALVTAAYTMMTLVKPTLGGMEWGSRHLLVIVPALVLLSWLAVENLLPQRDFHAARWQWSTGARPLLAGGAILAALSLALQLHGADVIHKIHGRNRQLSDMIAAVPDKVIVTAVWWAPLSGARSYMGKKVLYAGDRDHPAPPLFFRMSQNDIPSYTLIGFHPLDLSRFALPFGYVPVEGTTQSAPHELYLNRFVLIKELRDGGK